MNWIRRNGSHVSKLGTVIPDKRGEYFHAYTAKRYLGSFNALVSAKAAIEGSADSGGSGSTSPAQGRLL